MPRPGLPINQLVLAEHPVEFWWSTPGVEHPPAIKRVKISARNAEGEPLIVRQRKRIVHGITLTRLLRHIASKLPPRLGELLEAGDDLPRLDYATLLLRPIIRRKDGQAVCMHAKGGRVPGFSGGNGDYLHVVLGTDQHGKVVEERVHALICWLRYGPPPHQGSVGGQTLAVAAHAYGRFQCNDSRDCISPSHISWQTRQHNTRTHSAERRRAKRCA
jgi:hypothetical protein